MRLVQSENQLCGNQIFECRANGLEYGHLAIGHPTCDLSTAEFRKVADYIFCSNRTVRNRQNDVPSFL